MNNKNNTQNININIPMYHWGLMGPKKKETQKKLTKKIG